MKHGTASTDTRRRGLRGLWLRIHVWLGLTIGGILAVIGLTGSLLVFYTDIDEAILLRAPVHANAAQADAPLSYDAVVRVLRDTWPERDRAWRIELPSESTRVIRARYDHPAERTGSGYAPLLVWIDPGTLRIRHHAFWGDTPMTWVYDLHYTLLAGDAGRNLVGCAGIVALLSIGTGLALWWPKKRNFRAALAVRLNASRQRTVYDLHKIGGVYLLPLVALLIATGILLDMPATFRPAIERLSPLAPMPSCTSASAPGARRIDADAALAIAQRRFPDATPRWLETPDHPRGCYRVRLQADGEPSERFPATMVWVDPHAASVAAVRDARQRSAGDTLLAWLHPLHSGEAFGIAGRVAILLAGLALPLLFVTGLLRWRQKKVARARTAVARGVGV